MVKWFGACAAYDDAFDTFTFNPVIADFDYNLRSGTSPQKPWATNGSCYDLSYSATYELAGASIPTPSWINFTPTVGNAHLTV